MSDTTRIALYKVDGKDVPVEVRYMNETFWLTQKEMGELFDVGRPAIMRRASSMRFQQVPKWNWFKPREAARSRVR